MLQDSATTEYKHKIFVERVIESGLVWVLKSSDGVAVSGSNEYEDVQVIPFWSDKAYAKALAKEEWVEYNAESMPLLEFLENWIVGMHGDNILLGTNWDANMFGKETEPLEVALEICELLIANKKHLDFSKYSDLNDFYNQVKSAVN